MLKKITLLAFCIVIGLVIAFLPHPSEVSDQAWYLFAIFIFTIFGLILKPFAMGAMAFLGIVIASATKVLTFEQAFSGFASPVVWLIVSAFFIARGFIKTGLGLRIAYMLMKALGKSTLGLGYGIAFSDLILAPAIPSNTARMGGVIYPVVSSLSKAFDCLPTNSPRKIGAYLVQTLFQGGMITSAMFLTSMAGNPLIADLAKPLGINITWGNWAIAAIVPGLVSLLIVPYILYKIYPPKIKQTPDAKTFAENRLKKLGKVSLQEWLMLGVFMLLLVLWIFGSMIKIKAVVAALIGLMFLILLNVLSWSDILEEKNAWNTLVWFAALIALASNLNSLGLTTWFSNYIVASVKGINLSLGLAIVFLVYFYSHYFFASNVAHIGSMYQPFLILCIAFGAPKLLSALILGYFSSLFGSLTHYSCGPAALLYGAGYVDVKSWWRLGLIFSIINIIIWMLIGGTWWKLLGLY